MTEPSDENKQTTFSIARTQSEAAWRIAFHLTTRLHYHRPVICIRRDQASTRDLTGAMHARDQLKSTHSSSSVRAANNL